MKFLCYKCNKDIEESSYYKSSIKKKDYICKKCSKINNRKWRDKKIEEKDMNLKYSYAKSAAKTNGREFLLTKSEYVDLSLKKCYYCESPKYELGIGLDRIDNDKGYSLENVLPCCKLCNKIRNNILTVEEAKVAIMAVKKYRDSKKNN